MSILSIMSFIRVGVLAQSRRRARPGAPGAYFNLDPGKSVLTVFRFIEP
ncbi:MAG: hypothetical protein NUV93_04340 [Firmicutes bacterium]|nr:hypothetical protein [Bacillota bacterium]